MLSRDPGSLWHVDRICERNIEEANKVFWPNTRACWYFWDQWMKHGGGSMLLTPDKEVPLPFTEAAQRGSCFENGVRALRILYTSVFMENPGEMDVSAALNKRWERVTAKAECGTSWPGKGPCMNSITVLTDELGADWERRALAGGRWSRSWGTCPSRISARRGPPTRHCCWEELQWHTTVAFKVTTAYFQGIILLFLWILI